MFSIPEKHIDQLVADAKYPDVIDSIIEEMAELTVVLAKRDAGRMSYDDAVKRITEEMTHVLVSLNLLARSFGIGEKDVLNEVRAKALRDHFDISQY